MTGKCKTNYTSVCNVSDIQIRHFKPYILCIFNFFHLTALECHFLCLL